MDAAQLRPLSVGEILDISIKIYRERFATLVKAVAIVVGPVSLLTALVQVSVLPDAETFGTPIDSPVMTTPDFGDFWAFLAGILVVGLLGFIAAQVATAANFKIVSGTYLDAAPGWQESLRFALSSCVPWCGWRSSPVSSSGSASWRASCPASTSTARGWSPSPSSSSRIFGDDGRWGARGSWCRAGGGRPSAAGGHHPRCHRAGPHLRASLGGDLRRAERVRPGHRPGLGNTAGSVVTTPFTAAVVTVIYFDLRVRKEGFDLELLARRLGVDPPAVAPTDVRPPPSAAPPGQPSPWPPPSGWRPPDG